MRFGSLSAEKEVKVPPSEAWKMYGSLQLAKIVEQVPGLLSKIDLIQGDGGVGTILELFLPPGSDGAVKSYKEKFTVVDNDKLVKETEVVEGGYLDMGFTLYRIRLEVLDKEGNENECITRATIEYEVKEESVANAAFVSIQHLANIMQVAADHLLKNYSNLTDHEI